MDKKIYNIPSPIINKKEKYCVKKLTQQYEKMCKPGLIGKAGNGIKKAVPKVIKDKTKTAKRY